MKIVSSNVAMEGRSTHVAEETKSASLRVWGQNGSNQPAQQTSPIASDADRLVISSNGLSLAQTQAQTRNEMLASSSFINNDTGALSDVNETDELNPDDIFSDKDLQKIRLLEKMIEYLTGKKFKFNYLGYKRLHDAVERKSAHASPQPQSQMPEQAASQNAPAQRAAVGWGIHYREEETQYLKETVDFKSKGSVVTEDGRSIDFQINYHFSQEYWSSHSLEFKAGDALIDPLVIRLEDAPLAFSNDPISFDLDIDGANDTFKVPVDTAGMLFLDKNGNNVADDGSELFGPTTGKGFEELKALDSDQNGWIDEGDNAFKDMRIWVRSSDGSNRYLGLAEAGVGALFVGSVATEAGLYGNDTSQVGQMKNSSIYLKENGTASLVHELDFKV